MEKIKILTNKYKYLSFTIQHVFKANFNDTYYFETMYVDIAELTDKELVWIDPFNKRSKFNNLLVALSYIDENKYIIYIKQDEKITKEEALKNINQDLRNALLLVLNLRYQLKVCF